MKRATSDFFPGNEPIVNAGRVFADDHPYVSMYPKNFEELEVTEAPNKRRSAPVEQATAAPGEQRTTRK